MAEFRENSEMKVQQISCENDNCAHYINKHNWVKVGKPLPFARKKT